MYIALSVNMTKTLISSWKKKTILSNGITEYVIEDAYWLFTKKGESATRVQSPVLFCWVTFRIKTLRNARILSFNLPSCTLNSNGDWTIFPWVDNTIDMPSESKGNDFSIFLKRSDELKANKLKGIVEIHGRLSPGITNEHHSICV